MSSFRKYQSTSELAKNKVNDFLSDVSKNKLSTLNLVLDATPSTCSKSPRMDARTTWVGFDTQIPKNIIDDATQTPMHQSKTTAILVSNYFKSAGLDENDFIWRTVNKVQKGDGVKYFASKKSGRINASNIGFIYISKKQALLFFDDSRVSDKEDFACHLEMKSDALFSEELAKYTAWVLNDIYDITVRTLNNRAKFTTKSVYATGSAIDNVVSRAIVDILKSVDGFENRAIIHLKMKENKEVSGSARILSLYKILNTEINASLCVGNGNYNYDHQVLSFPFLVDSLTPFKQLRENTEHDLLLMMTKHLEILNKDDDYEKVDLWCVMNTLLDDSHYDEWNSTMIHALMRSIVDCIDDIEGIESLMLPDIYFNK